MFLQGQIGRIKDTYNEYPEHFWILIGARFIDALGGALIFPFLTLYVTSKFDIGMTQVGLLFGVYSIASIVGSALGGALTDRFGRKRIVILGLVTSALSSLVMGVTEEIQLFFWRRSFCRALCQCWRSGKSGDDSGYGTGGKTCPGFWDIKSYA